jgi:hypothetical protein
MDVNMAGLTAIGFIPEKDFAANISLSSSYEKG